MFNMRILRFNEAVLIGGDISKNLEILEYKIKNDEKITDPIKLLDFMDSMFTNDIFFIGLEDFKKITPNYVNTREVDGIYGAVTFTVNTFPIFIIVDEQKFLYNVYNKTSDIIHHIKTTLDHELVHREQFKRMGDKISYILGGKVQKIDNKYLEDPKELMAYARQIITELEKNFTKENILDFLRSGIVSSKTQEEYKTLRDMRTDDYPNGYINAKSYKRLLKYMYQYVSNYS